MNLGTKQIRPNLFIIGAMKSGTSSLHAYLNEHPDIFMCPVKEPSYFVSPAELRKIWPDLERKKYWENEEKYLELFDGCTTEKVIGESSTAYTKLNKVNGVADRIHAFDPNAKLIYIMRNPIDRAISHYWHAVAHDGEHRSMVDAFRKDPHYLEVSNYAMQLDPYLKFFPKTQIYVLTMEKLVTERLETLADIFEWLGVDPDFKPQFKKEKHNVTPAKISCVSFFGVLNRIRNSRIYDEVESFVPKSIRTFASSRMTHPMEIDRRQDDSARSYLRPRLKESIVRLEELVGRKFPEWNAASRN